MRKKFLCIAAFMVAASGPVTMTSCSEDEINTALQILELFLSGDDLSNTAWINADATFAIEFANGSGNLYDGDSTPIPFNYTVDTSNNILTLTYSDNSTEAVTVLSFEANKVLQIKRYNGKTYTLYPFTDEE